MYILSLFTNEIVFNNIDTTSEYNIIYNITTLIMI